MLASASSANNVPSRTADDDAVVPFDAALALADKKDDDAAVPFDAAALHAIDATSADGVATRSREL